MKKTLMLITVLACVFMFIGCGDKSDVLKGTWVGTYEDGDATWTFDGKGKCTLDNVLGEPMDGTYTIEDKSVNIKIDVWDTPTLYHFEIKDNKMTLKADNNYSPNYELTKENK